MTTASQANTTVQQGRSKYAVAAIALGIIGVVLAFLIPFLGWILGALAIVFGVISRPSWSKAGVTLGIVAIVVGVAMTLVYGNVVKHRKVQCVKSGNTTTCQQKTQ
ncbi:MAG TPA: hypothetical protein VHX59_00685 [Mycobacteriales bacterium]|jgi:uncharacterized membrane protein (DUF106 family)|nr:hypothetical protein [Mycobacteriales bacterium]